MHPKHTEFLEQIDQQEQGLREIVNSYKAALIQAADQGPRAVDDLRELIALNESALAQLEATRATLDALSDREWDIVAGIGPPPSSEELWGHKAG